MPQDNVLYRSDNSQNVMQIGSCMNATLLANALYYKYTTFKYCTRKQAVRLIFWNHKGLEIVYFSSDPHCYKDFLK